MRNNNNLFHLDTSQAPITIQDRDRLSDYVSISRYILQLHANAEEELQKKQKNPQIQLDSFTFAIRAGDLVTNARLKYTPANHIYRNMSEDEEYWHQNGITFKLVRTSEARLIEFTHSYSGEDITDEHSDNVDTTDELADIAFLGIIDLDDTEVDENEAEKEETTNEKDTDNTSIKSETKDHEIKEIADEDLEDWEDQDFPMYDEEEKETPDDDDITDYIRNKGEFDPKQEARDWAEYCKENNLTDYYSYADLPF